MIACNNFIRFGLAKLFFEKKGGVDLQMTNLSKKEKEVLEKPYGLLTDKEWAILNKLYNQEGVYKMSDETIKVLQKEKEKVGKNK